MVELNLPVNLEHNQNLALCHVHLSVVVKDDFPMCNPRILWNLYSLSRINFLDHEAKALTA